MLTLPILRVAALVVRDDPRLGPTGWRAEYLLADDGGPVRAVGFASLARRAEGVLPFDVDALRLHLAVTIAADPARWDGTPPPLVDGTPALVADGPCTGVRSASHGPDGALEAYAAWVVWGPDTPDHLRLAPGAVLPALLRALDPTEATITWEARPLDARDLADAAALALAVARPG